ncbi:MAG: Fic family protein [Alphaproteobacteria bacterium]
MITSGHKIDTGKGYNAFRPLLLKNVGQELNISSLYSDITSATLALGELNAINQLLPNPDLLIEKYALKEAVLSSQIEGTQSTMIEVLENEDNFNPTIDVLEVKNYLNAMKFGVDQIKNNKLPLSSRLLRECHNILMKNVRGGENNKTPGEFRKSQNYIGGSKPSDAVFVPPIEDDIADLMSDLEKYIHYGNLPDVINIALIHYQFETIHPFLDGNGRIGRLLISLFLIHKGILNHPTLYLSLYLKKHKIEYYDLLTNVRENNDYTRWISFFLKGITSVCKQIIETTKKIQKLKDDKLLVVKGDKEHKLLDIVFIRPALDISFVEKELSISKATANKLVNSFVDKKILVQSNKTQRYKKYIFKEYIDIIEAEL